jgi:hypothetical protein
MKTAWCGQKKHRVPRRGTDRWWTQQAAVVAAYEPTLFDALPEFKFGPLDTAGPEDNPCRDTSDWYSRMKWDQDHGFADYS